MSRFFFLLLALSGCCRDTLTQIEAALPPPKAPAPVAELIPARAIDLIIAFEIGSPETYEKRYQAPIWPGAASGVTVGIGYDLGHQHAAVIEQDWAVVPAHPRLAEQAGITGPAAKLRLPPLQDIKIRYATAREVFDATSVVTYYRLMLRTFPGAQALPAHAQGALTSLVYNRGGSTKGASRLEMRTIQQECVPAVDVQCIARQIRAMSRIWKGSAIEKGMTRRREAEAELAVQS